MKYIALRLIIFYQLFISPLLKQIFGINYFCRFSPTCSEYARQSVEKHGVLKGGAFSIKRILSCNPFGNPNFKFNS